MIKKAADPIAEMRERAEKYWREWVETPEGGCSLLIAAGDSATPINRFAAAFALTELRRLGASAQQGPSAQETFAWLKANYFNWAGGSVASKDGTISGERSLAEVLADFAQSFSVGASGVDVEGYWSWESIETRIWDAAMQDYKYEHNTLRDVIRREFEGLRKHIALPAATEEKV